MVVLFFGRCDNFFKCKYAVSVLILQVNTETCRLSTEILWVVSLGTYQLEKNISR